MKTDTYIYILHVKIYKYNYIYNIYSIYIYITYVSVCAVCICTYAIICMSLSQNQEHADFAPSHSGGRENRVEPWSVAPLHWRSLDRRAGANNLEQVVPRDVM